MFEIRSIEHGPIAALNTNPILIHKSYFPPGTLAKGDRVVVEIDGSCAVGTDPAPTQVLFVQVNLDTGLTNPMQVSVIGSNVDNAHTPNWVHQSIGFEIGADGFLYLPDTQVQFTPLSGPVTEFQVVGEQMVTPPTAIVAPLDRNSARTGKSSVAFNTNAQHRITVFAFFGQVQADNIFTTLAGRTIVYQPRSGNTASQ